MSKATTAALLTLALTKELEYVEDKDEAELNVQERYERFLDYTS